MDMKALAAQLRKPEGNEGKEVGNLMSRGNKQIIEWSIDALDLQANERILEIGMGNGAFVSSLLLHHPSVSYTGCDHSFLMVEEARSTNASVYEKARVRFDTAEAAELPYENAAFSRVLTINTIYFWGEAVAELREIKRVLQETGLFVIGIRSEQTMDQMPFTSFGFRKYGEKALLQLLQENGFNVLTSLCRKEPPYEFEGRTITLENIIVTCAPRTGQPGVQ